jgi:hypothetical protein
MHPFQEFIDEAKENRRAFLIPYREKFEAALTKEARATIIVELIEIEPSHLSEPWIVNETISWLRNCNNCKNYINDVFVKAPKRHTTTELQRIKNVKAFYLRIDVNRIIKKHDCSVRKACAILINELRDEGKNEYLGWDLSDNIIDVEKSFRQVYNTIKDDIKTFYPPYPYYGRDIIETDGKIKLFGE